MVILKGGGEMKFSIIKARVILAELKRQCIDEIKSLLKKQKVPYKERDYSKMMIEELFFSIETLREKIPKSKGLPFKNSNYQFINGDSQDTCL
jgi:hypothetical protein